MSTPVLAAPTVTSEMRVEVLVEDTGGNPLVQIDYAVADTAPAHDSKLWKLAGRVATEARIQTPSMLPNQRTWIRASGRTDVAPYARTSPYTEPVYVEIGDEARFDSISMRLDASRRPVVEWDAGALMQGVLVEWAIYARGDTVPDSFADVAHIEAADGAHQIDQSVGENETVAIRVTAYSGWDSDHDMVHGEAGQQALFIESPGTPDVEAHAFTHEHDGSDPIDLGALVIESPNGTRWRLVVDDAGVLSTEPIVDSSSGPSSS